MSYEQIRYDTEGPIATITLNRPERMNAFTGQMRDELIAAFDVADADDAIRAVIVTGSGRAFCAGADLEAGAKTFDYHKRNAETEADHRDGGGMVTLRIFDMRKPVIAAINGPAVGIGITMTLAMDFRLAAEGAKIGFVFARRGIVPEASSSWFLPRLVGVAQALDWVLTGRIFGAEEAVAKGLFSRALPAEELLPAARAIAMEIASNTSAISVALSRRMLWTMIGATHPMQAHRIESKSLHFTGASEDAKEGVLSFLEKRPANFKLGPSKDMPDFYPWNQEKWSES